MTLDVSQGAAGSALAPEVVTLPAEIDITNAAGVCQQIGAALRTGASVVIADMTQTAFCDSSGIRDLLISQDRAMASNAVLRIAGLTPAVRRVLQVTGVDKILSIYPSVHAALTDEHPGT